MAKEQPTNRAKEEFGKWLMDIAKYITTAVIISTIFGNFENEGWVLVIGVALAISLMYIGLLFISKNQKTTKKRQ